MAAPLSAGELTGLCDTHLVGVAGGHRLHAAAADAWAALVADAGQAGFELAIASSYRDCARQVAIWNGKACWNGMSKTAIWPRMRWMTTR